MAGRRRDDGFTIVEVLVAITLLGVVMTALTSFFIQTLGVANAQSGRQSAAKVAADAVEKVRALKSSAVTAGRDKTSSDTQWNSPVTGVAAYLADSVEAYDSTATFPAGATAPLPTAASPVTVDGLVYQRYWYIGSCWQPASGGSCGPAQATDYVQYYRVIVAVTWTEQHCTNQTCSYVVPTLISSASSDPVFNSNDTAVAPKVNNPGNQTGETTGPISVQIASTGGAPPLIWSATGLPPGLSISSAGLITGTPTTTGTYTVTVSTTDGFGLIGTANFNWVITVGPALTNPGAQNTPGGTAVNLPITRTGGTAPFSWAATKPASWGATGLPPGLSINATTGVITGTPTKAGTANVTITVTDDYDATASVTFAWTVPPLTLANPGNQTIKVGGPASIDTNPSGGIPAYSYAATNLPTGLSINATTGDITGTPTVLGNKNVTVTVTDASGATASVSYTIIVIQGPTITGPADRADVVNTSTNFNATATGGSGPYTWTATNLPPGVGMNANGQFTSRPTGTTRYIVTLTVTDGNGVTDTGTFSWTLTPSSSGTLRVTSPTGDRTSALNSTVSLIATAAGGTGVYTWSATGLPTGLTISGAGTISGKPTVAGEYITKLTVRDSSAATSVFMLFWTVA